MKDGIIKNTNVVLFKDQFFLGDHSALTGSIADVAKVTLVSPKWIQKEGAR